MASHRAPCGPRRPAALCSAGHRSDFVDQLEVGIGGRTVRVGEILRYRTELAANLHSLDRVHTYGSFFIADLAV